MGECSRVPDLLASGGLDPRVIIRSFEQYCDLSRQYDPEPSPATLPDGTVVPAYKGPGVDPFVADFGRLDLLAFSACFSRFARRAYV